MNFRLIVVFLAMTLPGISLAQLIAGSAYMIGDNIEIGINEGGHEGAPLLATSNNRSNQAVTSPVYFGFVANPQIDGWTNYDGDFFTPGSPENGFGLEIGGINYSNNASGTLEQIEGSISSYDVDGDCMTVVWDGSIGDIDMQIVYRLITTELYYTTEVSLTNTGGTDYTDIFYYRNLDPDNNVTIGGGYATQNTIVAQPEPGCEKALVTATQTGPWESYIGLGAIGEDFRVTYGGFANRDGSNVWNAAGGLTGGVGATTFSDQAISLAYRVNDLPAGETETFLFTIVLDDAYIDAAISSLYYFDYAGGGGVIDECNPMVDTAETCAGMPVTISVDGPNADDYTWAWTPPVGLSTTVGPTTDASPAVTTTYTVTGTPAPACLSSTIEKSIVVEIVPSPIIDIVDPGPQCEEFDLTTLIVNDLAGIPSPIIEFYSVVPDSIDQTVGIWPSTMMYPGDVVYVMLGDPALGCFDVEPVTITFVTSPNSGADNTSSLCNSPGTTIDLNTLLSGADPGGTWAEVTGSGAFNPLTGVFNASGLASGDYVFTYLTSNPPCPDDIAEFTITVLPNPVIDAGPDVAICDGDGIVLSGTGAGVGGSYTWTGGVADGLPFIPVATTTYTVTGTNAEGCSNTDDITVTVNPLPVVDAGVDAAICAGDLITLSGVGAVTYAWDGGVTDGVAFSPAATATYTVTGTDANGCIDTDDITITVNPLPVVDAGVDAAICAGDLITLSGAGAVTYAWDGGVTDGVAFSPAATATYTVTGTDANGCVNTDDITITVNALPAVDAGPDMDVCEGGSVTLSGAGAGLGGTYVWTGGILDGVPFVPGGTGTYTVTGTDVNGCVNTDDITVNVNILLPVDAGADFDICIGDEATLAGDGAGIGGVYTWDGGVLDGVPFTPVATADYIVTGVDVNGCINTDTISVVVNPLPVVDAGADFAICDGDEATVFGAGAVTYVWDGGVADGVPFTPAATTTYTVTGTDANGCVNTDDIMVTVNPLPIVDAGLDHAICAGDMTTLFGAGAVTYAWDGGVIDGVAFSPVATATFTVIGTDANGCVNTDDITVTINALPAVEAGLDEAICIGDWIALYGSGAGIGATYEWDGGGIDGVAFSPGTTAMYTVTGTDTDGCENTDSVWVVVNDLPVVDAGEDAEMCAGEMMILDGVGAGPGATYAWDGGEEDGVPFEPGATEMYTVTATDENGCVNTDSVMVVVNPLPVINAGPDQVICTGDNVMLEGAGAGVGGSYIWTGGVMDGVTFTPGATDTYTVIGTDINGCESFDDVTVTLMDLPVVDAGADVEICIGDAVTLSGTGAGPGGTYSWDGGIGDGIAFSPDYSGTYTVTGTNAGGCSSTDEVEVIVIPLPVVAFEADMLQGCAPFEIEFSSLNPGATFSWEFGDGDGASGEGTSHVYDYSGTYDVTLTMTSPEGCVNTETYEDYIDIVPAPIASFYYAPDDITVQDTRVDFTNESLYADSYEWDFGDGFGIVNAENPSHTFPVIGNSEYMVTLTAISDYGCEDIAQQLVVIKDQLIYYIPNTFTPDGDTFNEVFKPVFVAGYDIYDYHLMIFNRWGEMVFESYDANYGWNGTYGNGGLVDDGVYIYRIEFGETMSDKVIKLNGHITVLK